MSATIYTYYVMDRKEPTRDFTKTPLQTRFPIVSPSIIFIGTILGVHLPCISWTLMCKCGSGSLLASCLGLGESRWGHHDKQDVYSFPGIGLTVDLRKLAFGFGVAEPQCYGNDCCLLVRDAQSSNWEPWLTVSTIQIEATT
jgi:hypothetical protein